MHLRLRLEDSKSWVPERSGWAQEYTEDTTNMNMGIVSLIRIFTMPPPQVPSATGWFWSTNMVRMFFHISHYLLLINLNYSLCTSLTINRLALIVGFIRNGGLLGAALDTKCLCGVDTRGYIRNRVLGGVWLGCK